MANRFLFVAAVAAVALANVASAQTQAYSPAGYSPLLFDPTDTKYVFRLNGAPWICRGDTFCKPVKIEGVADKELSALLRGNRLVPVMDEVTFEQLVKVSPLLASRSGLSTKENTWPEIIEQIDDLVKVHRPAT